MGLIDFFGKKQKINGNSIEISTQVRDLNKIISLFKNLENSYNEFSSEIKIGPQDLDGSQRTQLQNLISQWENLINSIFSLYSSKLKEEENEEPYKSILELLEKYRIYIIPHQVKINDVKIDHAMGFLIKIKTFLKTILDSLEQIEKTYIAQEKQRDKEFRENQFKQQERDFTFSQRQAKKEFDKKRAA